VSQYSIDGADKPPYNENNGQIEGGIPGHVEKPINCIGHRGFLYLGLHYTAWWFATGSAI
jgi:hypothetical protein